MRGLLNTLLVLWISFLLSSPIAHASDSQPVIIALGGHSYCPTKFLNGNSIHDMNQYAEILGKQIEEKNKKPPLYLSTCFSGFPSLKLFRSLELQYTTTPSEYPDFHADETLVTPLNKLKDNSFDKFFSEIENTLKGIDNPKVTLFGHSYGAWMAIKLASRIQSKGWLSGLITVDPISPIECRPNQIVKALIGALSKGKYGCQRAPKFKKGLVSKTKGALDYWINFYQRRHPFIRSSQIKEIGKNANHRIRMGLNFNSHDRVLYHHNTWRVIESKLK